MLISPISFSQLTVADLWWKEEAGGASWRLERVLLWWFKSTSEYFVIFLSTFQWTHMSHRVSTLKSRLLPPAAWSLAAVWEEHWGCGGAVARPAPLLYRGLWLQRACCLYPSAWPPHHLQQAVDIQIHCHWRSDIKHRSIEFHKMDATDCLSTLTIIRLSKLYVIHCIVEFCCFLVSVHITDPFDLNHNLGAGLSRKSMIPVFSVVSFVLLAFSLFKSNAFSCLPFSSH